LALPSEPVVICWGNGPRRGKCQNEATHFFLARGHETKGWVPANRAVCDGCAAAYRFDALVIRGVVREVEPDEWKRLGTTSEIEHRRTCWVRLLGDPSI
jgi:hypothetical protein